MAKYRKKPITVEAEIYQKGMEDGFEKVHQNDCFCCQDSCYGCIHYKPYLNTRQGKVYISKNDMIITQSDGERYPCNPINFEMTYELIPNDPPIPNPPKIEVIKVKY